MKYGKIKCEICSAEAHFIEAHLKEEHDMTIEDYQNAYPSAPIMSEAAKARLSELSKGSNNKKVVYSISKLFGINVFGGKDEIVGFENPHSTTPKIDPDYIFSQQLLASCLYAVMNRNEPMLLSGPTGSGKSSVITQIAARLNLPYYRINCDMDISRADFVGQWVLHGKEMRFQYGILPRAMREGAIFIQDESDTANPGVAMAMQAVLEDDGKLTIAETGELVSPHEDFRVFCTANTLGMGDETGLYNGTQPQNFATLDRMKIVEIVDYPEAKAEKKIITSKVGISDKDILDKLCNYAKLIREAFKKDEIRVTMSTRTIINIAQKLVDFGDVKSAYRVAYINKCSGEDRKFAEEILQRIWAV